MGTLSRRITNACLLLGDMNPSDIITALREIQQGFSWLDSSIEPKTEAKKDDWDRMKAEYDEQQKQFG